LFGVGSFSVQQYNTCLVDDQAEGILIGSVLLSQQQQQKIIIMQMKLNGKQKVTFTPHGLVCSLLFSIVI
jgi:hypothetical protein